MTSRIAAVDLGASSVRVAVVDLEADRPEVEIVSRVAHRPTRRGDGTLRWELDRIVSAVHTGIERALEDGRLASIGVDTWGVDYGLLDADGIPLADPVAYRDARTTSWRQTVERVGERRLYELAGLQLVPYTTLFQLAAHDRDELASASRLLMMPELVTHLLADGIDHVVGRTPAGTTGLIGIDDGGWSDELVAAAGIPHRLLPTVITEPRPVGRFRGVPVQLTAGHDTACAFAAAAGPEAIVLSAGTWLLVGMLVADPFTGEDAFDANLSNEPAYPAGFRLLRNVAGMWLLDRCLDAWGISIRDATEHLDVELDGPTFDATDTRFLAPDDMPAAIAAAAGLPDPADTRTVTSCILRSLATTTAGIVDDLRTVTSRSPTEIVIVGGGSRIAALNGLLELACGLPVRVGPVEATALGNALIQGIGLRRFASLQEAQRWMR